MVYWDQHNRDRDQSLTETETALNGQKSETEQPCFGNKLHFTKKLGCGANCNWERSIPVQKTFVSRPLK